MKYIISVYGDDEGPEDRPVLWSRSLPPGEEAYLRQSVFPAMQPLSDEEYRNGPANIVTTAAPSSYILDGDVMYWCVQWEPGLVVIRFAPDHSLVWARLPSPNPQFGGREATDEELENYDEDNEEETHQYKLVFDAWDAQFDEDEREDWEIARDDIKNRFQAALAYADAKAKPSQMAVDAV